MTMSRQEIFDKAYRGLRAQGFELSMIGDGCAYRGFYGKKCAISHCIDDDYYHEEMEGKKASGLTELSRIFNFSRDGFFLNELQRCHDLSVSPEDMKTRLEKFAKEYALKIPGEDSHD